MRIVIKNGSGKYTFLLHSTSTKTTSLTENRTYNIVYYELELLETYYFQLNLMTNKVFERPFLLELEPLIDF